MLLLFKGDKTFFLLVRFRQKSRIEMQNFTEKKKTHTVATKGRATDGRTWNFVIDGSALLMLWWVDGSPSGNWMAWLKRLIMRGSGWLSACFGAGWHLWFYITSWKSSLVMTRSIFFLFYIYLVSLL